MIKKYMAIIFFGVAYFLQLPVFAVDANLSESDKFIVEMFKMHDGKTVCSPIGDASLSSVRKSIFNYLNQRGISERSTAEDVAKAIWAIYPCPFSPFRSELKLANKEEITGIWIFPEDSQKLRYGPKSTQSSPMGPVPVKCEMVAYLPEGELRNAMYGKSSNITRPDTSECPFKTEKDLEAMRKFPHVSSWHFQQEGRVAITRTDVVNHIEEWDIYIVQKDFSAYGVNFNAGDLAAFLRKAANNNIGATVQFRHLKKVSAI